MTELNNFKKISVESFIKLFRKSNPTENIEELKSQLNYFKTLKRKGENCKCGNPIWIIGSAISGKGCFTCITGESYSDNDYEIK
jgi:hypothetical protein